MKKRRFYFLDFIDKFIYTHGLFILISKKKNTNPDTSKSYKIQSNKDVKRPFYQKI